MCGYLGTISSNSIEKNKLIESNNRIICRGPDETKIVHNEGTHFSNKLNYFFAFNRLAIQDLSKNGSQPMYSAEFNTAVLFNGEVYNNNELRELLEGNGLNFKSNNSDTEVVLLGLSFFGVSFIEKIIGQFAITFCDFNKCEIYLIRDRLGQKPLFYFSENNSLIFSSNLISIKEITNSNVDLESLESYISLGVVPSPKTIYKNIYKVKPGELIKFNKELKIDKKLTYWDLESFVDNSKFNYSEFINLFNDSVSKRQLADVEVANFLSGGLDSTAIVKSLVESGYDINTYSLGFSNKKYDESKWSQLVADKYETNHWQDSLSFNISEEDINKSISAFDEPYADPSTIPSYILSREIAKKFKVAISGDGGDELLGGYKRTYQSLYPKPNIFGFLYDYYPSFLGTGNYFRRNHNNLGIRYSSYFEDIKLCNLLNTHSSTKYIEDYFKPLENKYKALLISDYKFYLPEMMMLKIDRTSMANSLEVRSPFVDHRLVEYVLSTDTSYFSKNISKPLIRKFLKNDFNNNFLDRNKMGFAFQLEDWVYKNIETIFDSINEDSITSQYSQKLKLLKINKSRINALRIWKIYFLSKYLNS